MRGAVQSHVMSGGLGFWIPEPRMRQSEMNYLQQSGKEHVVREYKNRIYFSRLNAYNP